MNQLPKQISHPAAWTSIELSERKAEWVYTLTHDDLTELDLALRGLEAGGLVVPYFGEEEFPVPKLIAKLRPMIEALDSGLGILQITGLPRSEYSKDQASTLFWGLGAHIGRPWEQNAKGDVLGDVRDTGRSFEDPNARGYQTDVEMELHTDVADITGLLCLNKALEGGASQIASSISVLNTLIEREPTAAQHLLSKEFYFDWRGEEGEGEQPYFCAKIFEETEKGMTSFPVFPYVRSAQRFEEVPRLTSEDKAAMKAFYRATSEGDLIFEFMQQPGEMLFFNNYFLMHGRSNFTDHEDPRDKRHLRRLWLERQSWSGHRSRAMETYLDNVSRNWRSEESSVTMWDET